MENQGKRLLIAVALALGVLFAWQLIFPQKEPPKQKETATQPATPVEAASSSTVGLTTDGKPASAPSAKRGPEQTIEMTFPNVEVAFSSYGGVIKSWHLTDPRFDRDKTKGQLVPEQAPTGLFEVNFSNSTLVLPAETEWTGTKLSDRAVKYTLDTPQLTLEKTYEIVPEAYLVKLSVKATPKAGGDANQALAVTLYSFQDPKDDGGGGQSIAARVWNSSTLRGEEIFHTGVKALIQKPRYEYNFTWTGFEHPFMLVAAAPKPQETGLLEKQTTAQASGLMRTDIIYPHEVLRGKQTLDEQLVAYMGPKNLSQLEAADEIAGFPTGFNTTIDLGWFAFIGRPLMWLLLQFYSFVQNWGIAIVLLTILVKGATIPFTTKSMRSMKAMAVLAPEMKALQEKYKHDRQRLQMETMALYKQHGANPLSGCLPIMLQMPIWLALYRMLSATGELYQQPFIPGWINDLTTSDPFYVLPIVLMVTMFLQARLTPMSPDPSQKLQQNMMKYGMPLMFGVMSFFFPAGLTLYIFTNTILSALHSIWMNKFDKKSLAIAAKIKAAQEKAAQEKDKAAAAKAKPANVKDTDSDDDDADGKPAGSPAKITPRPNPNRPKRKKRRR